MLALYRTGRQADALRAFQRLRTLLADELGLEPSAELKALEDAILAQKSELEWRAPSDPASSQVRSGPAGAPSGGGRSSLRRDRRPGVW